MHCHSSPPARASSKGIEVSIVSSLKGKSCSKQQMSSWRPGFHGIWSLAVAPIRLSYFLVSVLYQNSCILGQICVVIFWLCLDQNRDFWSKMRQSCPKVLLCYLLYDDLTGNSITINTVSASAEFKMHHLLWLCLNIHIHLLCRNTQIFSRCCE